MTTRNPTGGKWTIDENDEWCHGLGKKIAIQRQEYALVMHKRCPLNVWLFMDMRWSLHIQKRTTQ